jgi:hypothetical protein
MQRKRLVTAPAIEVIIGSNLQPDEPLAGWLVTEPKC